MASPSRKLQIKSYKDAKDGYDECTTKVNIQSELMNKNEIGEGLSLN